MEKKYQMLKERREYRDAEGRICVISSVTLPEFIPGYGLSARADEFYKEMRARFDAFCGKKLLKRACGAKRGRPWGAVMSARVTLDDGDHVSVIIDARVFDGEKNGATARVAQVWNAADGTMESVNAFVPPEFRTAVTDIICAAVRERQSTGGSFFKSDAQKTVRSRFSPRSFYLVPGGVAFYFDAFVLSESPFPEVFTVKYDDMRK